MLRTRHSRLEQEITSLLERERAALLTGDLSELSALVERKTDAFARIDQSVISMQVLQALTRRSRENQSLYAAVLKGLRAVQERLDSVRAAQSGFSVYDQAGVSKNIGDASVQRIVKA